MFSADEVDLVPRRNAGDTRGIKLRTACNQCTLSKVNTALRSRKSFRLIPVFLGQVLWRENRLRKV